MQPARNRLLLLLALLIVGVALFRAPAQAATSTKFAANANVTIGGLQQPAPRPTPVGEPDVPQNGPKSLTRTDSQWGNGHWFAMVRLAGRFWMVRYLGVR
jgi:hypothetical protein